MHCNSIAILEVTDPSGNRLPVPAGRLRAGARPEHRRRHQRAAAGRHRARHRRPGRTSAGRRPARPAPPTGGSRSGSSATPRTSRPPSGPATRARRRRLPAAATALIGGVYYGDVCGGCLPGPIWQQMMSRTLADTPVSSFTDAADDVRSGDSHHGPVGHRQVGRRRPRRCCGRPSSTRSSATTRSTSTYAPAGTVAYSYPGTGASVYPGQRVVIYVSAGPPAAEPSETTRPGPGPSDPDSRTSGPEPGGHLRQLQPARAAATGAAEPPAGRRQPAS